MRRNQIKVLGMAVIIFGLLPAVMVFAQATITISPNLPGSLNTTPSGTSPGAYIKNFYSYALFLSGLLAFGAIVYGGIKYAVARGNPSGESEAKQWIWSALLGMLLLAGAYIILFTVNPNLVNLALPGLPAPAAQTSGGGIGGGGGNASNFSPGLAGNGATNAISASAISYFGTNTSGGPSGGKEACAWAVNNVLTKAGIAPLDSSSVQSMENALTSGRGTQVDPSAAKAGDIVIQAQDGHVGICMNDGCTQVLSNSSSKASFSWISNTSFAPSYSAGPGRIYQVNH